MESNQLTIKVLIADDEVAIRNGLQKIVNIDQFDIHIVDTAENGKIALNRIQQLKPDIAIIDINMPEMDGLEVIRLSLESESATRFFILSGYDDFSYAQTAICYGVKYYFLKPLNIAEFRKQFIKQCEEILHEREAIFSQNGRDMDAFLSSSRIMFLNQLVQGKIYQSDQMIDHLSQLYLSIENKKSCVLVFRFSDCKGESLNMDYIKDEIIGPALIGYPMESWVYDTHQILGIVNLDNDQDPLFTMHLRDCYRMLTNRLECYTLIGVGTIIETLNQCQDSFLKAQEALTYHIYQQDIGIFDTHIISDNAPTFSKENIDLAPVIHAILHSNSEGITEYCNLFFQSLFYIKMPPPNFLFGMCMYLIMQVQKQLLMMYPDRKLNLDTKFEEASSFESIHYLNSWMINTFMAYVDAIRKMNIESNEIIKRSKEYIQEHLHQNIKVRDVAAHISLSESYFAIYFKEKTGINFRDYILTAKIEYAKKILKNKKTSISEIAEKVGYQDYRSFSRAFKNETGMSPSDYCNHIEV